MSLSCRGGATVATEEDGAAAWQQRWQRRPSAAAFEAANGAEVVEGNHHKVTIEGRDSGILWAGAVIGTTGKGEAIEVAREDGSGRPTTIKKRRSRLQEKGGWRLEEEIKAAARNGDGLG
ncbi:hypothetical protein BHM03_00001742 [Ensete ventricosum]|uniref:Uncharacterized protein n=1 Tax=Ensete ventricosum TaxID=4639 RepID=A0A445M998_ENSVE|nr:hypothetical protein BHM03_00001742 [Ensete ventricosum]